MVENVWESRFQYVDDLKTMGGDVMIAGHTALINGSSQLTGAKVMARDLRAGAAMVLAGLNAAGETEVTDINKIERGYEDFVNKMRMLGADITRIEG